MGGATNLLIYLAEKGALYKQIELSTILMAKEIKTSQQTISRKLVDLEKKRLIDRNASTRGIKITIREEGKEKLKELYLCLKSLLGEKTQSFTGTVESGLGEGSYYVSLKPYLEQFRTKIGFMPYKGTLNLKIDYTDFIRIITRQQKIVIGGFSTATRTFGSILAYKIKVNNIGAAIIIPERTSHKRDVIEVISNTYLRKKLNLKDGDKVKITAG
ncbi:MAG: CTP-dependent riboflavin kinase [Nanoarchaeota archaeon]|nr:CTP-dependent riboflavin kinase [Nanoarchaeota archaeon]